MVACKAAVSLGYQQRPPVVRICRSLAGAEALARLDMEV